MLRRNTLFVVGAGASAELNLPTGLELCQRIKDKLRLEDSGKLNKSFVHEDILHACRCAANHIEPITLGGLQQAAEAVADAMPIAPSIDEYMHAHSDDPHVEACCKIAIASIIAGCERASPLSMNYENIYNKPALRGVSNCWHAKLWRMLVAGTSPMRRNHLFHDLSFLIFNYDRCIEHFLYYATVVYMKMPKEDAAHLVSSVRIYHPYGKIGPLEWEVGQSGEKVRFGEVERRPEHLFRAARGIRTFLEGFDEEDLSSSIRRAVEDAEAIVFLGFGFNEQNMRFLQSDARARSGKILGTAYGLSENTRADHEQTIRGILNTDLPIYLENTTCSALFDQYETLLRR